MMTSNLRSTKDTTAIIIRREELRNASKRVATVVIILKPNTVV
jgi:hypothetical protein